MKSLLVTLITLMIAGGNLFAQNFPITVNDRIHKYIYKIHDRQTDVHRSGLLDRHDDLFDNITDDAAFSALSDGQEKSTEKRMAGAGETDATDEYRVMYDEARQKLERFLQTRFPPKGFSITYDQYFHEFQILPVHDPKPSSVELSLEALQKRSDKVLREYLPFLKNQLEYDNYRINYENKNISSAIFMYRRIFKKRIVNTDVSTLELSLTAQGRLRAITLKWPFFKKAENIPVSSSIDISEGTSAAINEIQANYSIVSPMGGNPNDTMLARHAEILGVARSWFPAELDDGSILLTPCLSYTTKIDYRNDVTNTPIIDVPVLKKYFR